MKISYHKAKSYKPKGSVCFACESLSQLRNILLRNSWEGSWANVQNIEKRVFFLYFNMSESPINVFRFELLLHK